MKRLSKLILTLGFLIACFVLQSSFGDSSTNRVTGTLLYGETSSKEALKLFEVKCRVCQQVKDPFIILKKSSALIGARTIYRRVLQMRIYQREARRR
ncbi:hypothetical protein BFP71_14255 [Roseivirga misakiensis]|uniref:Cytochrome c domain-containing protein n=1 Tax=Roseivirga misakiensis TaxID=1563681 RepID=A0A1E5SZT3_9BACT|nr:hypothetical protein BFP71_14255 [Roseivirga misakiensis]